MSRTMVPDVGTSRVPLPEVSGVEHRMVDVGGLDVHVAEVGTGPPLVLLHGWPQHWFCWRRVVPLLADDFRLIMPDLRGHGWTQAPRDGYEKEQLATDLLGLLDVLELDEVGLVGHDWGGWVGFLACLRAPERFSRFLALGIVHPFQRLSPAKLAQAWRGTYQLLLSMPVVAQASLQSNPYLVSNMIRLASAQPEAFSHGESRIYADVLREPARARASVRMYRTFVLHELRQLHRYQEGYLEMPVRLMIGSRDPIGSRALLDGWQDHAADMSVDVVPGAGHFLPEEMPAQVATAARTLFSGLS